MIATLLAGSTLALVAGVVVAATQPAPKPASATADHTLAPKDPAVRKLPPLTTTTYPSKAQQLEALKTLGTSGHRSEAAEAGQMQKPAITYVVQPGDTLSAIAEWFKLHGYGHLYAENAKTIGSNANLIRPGERITLGSGAMTTSSPS